MNLEIQQIGTQVVGFLILLWILRRFAWGPLFQVLEERRARIAREIAEVEGLKAELGRLEADYKTRLADLDAQARQRLLEAVEEGRRVSREIQEKAREDAAKTIERARQSLELEITAARTHLHDEVVTLALMAAERVIRERLDDAKHRQVVADFIAQVERVT